MKSIIVILLLSGLLGVFQGYAQLTNQDYVKAGWMTTRMYGGNRSGDGPNWLIMTYGSGKDFVKDADGSYSLKGGWHDCGDHVKFGQTQYYAGYMLLLGYATFPQGYDDFYSADYNGYRTANDFSWEGKKGNPNGIPDILDEVKYATDYFIKCARNGTTFYSQVGNGNYDHKHWVTSVTMAGYSLTDGGEASGTRAIKKNPNDASMASFCGATLALMSRMYRPFDAAYADLCLQHAIYAYQYASTHKTNAGGGTIEGSFYNADNKWEDNYVCLLAELYWATGNDAYKQEALSYSMSIADHGWVLDYENSDDLAAFALAKLGDARGANELKKMCTRYKNAYTGGVMRVGSSWGRLRYTASACFVLALEHSLNKDNAVHTALQGSIDYILGVNSAGQSFVVGFGTKSPKYPHHRNVFMNDSKNYTIPVKNRQHGYLVGGTYDPATFPDNIDNYQTSEGGIDYNAGLVGALGYINSIKSPVDQSKFGIFYCKTPYLGDDKSLCGLSSITLNTQLTTTNRTFVWQKDGVTLSNTTPSITITQGGTYKVTVDSLGCVSSDVIVISNTIPSVNLGADKVIQTSVLLDAGVAGDALQYTWKRNNVVLSAQTKTITVTEAGTYSVTVSGAGCASQSDEIVLSLPPAILKTAATIAIDAVKDAAYFESATIDKVLMGTPSASNLSASWSALWDNTNVYIFVSVTDNDKRNDSGTSWWEDDGVEIFIDANNSKGSSYDANDFQWGFVWGRTTAIAGGNNPANSLTGVTFAMIATATGYDLEVRIPWTTLKVTPTANMNLGFDIAVNDDDGGNLRENKIAWNATVDDGWQNPSVFGTVKLLDIPNPVISQTIQLEAGWNLISLYVVPQQASVATVFASTGFTMVKNADGFYNPLMPIQLQSISQIEAGKAYLLQVPQATVLTVEGTMATVSTSQLNPGWNMLGVPKNSVQSIATKLQGTSVTQVKNFDGFYVPGSATNSITTFTPGEGYYLFSTGASTITW